MLLLSGQILAGEEAIIVRLEKTSEQRRWPKTQPLPLKLQSSCLCLDASTPILTWQYMIHINYMIKTVAP